MKTREPILKRITTSPEVMLGKPTIRGTRLTVEVILEKLGYGASEAELLNNYPFLELQDIQACLLYAVQMLALEEIVEL